MIEIILVAVAGSILAGIWDLKTTEVPDHLLVGMAVVGIVYWLANSIFTGDWYPFIVSVVVGTALLLLGLVMYKKGQWGGADAWILAAIGYMIPLYNGIFIVPYLFNFMLVAIAYTVIYSVALGVMNPHVIKHVRKDYRENVRLVVGIPLAIAAVIIALSAQVPAFFALTFRLVPLILLLLLFWRYAVVVEKRLFKKKIPVSRLKVGDVLERGNWIGVTEKDIRKLRKSRRFVVIKDGMRFVPVFAIALVLTLLFGNLFFLL